MTWNMEKTKTPRQMRTRAPLAARAVTAIGSDVNASCPLRMAAGMAKPPATKQIIIVAVPMAQFFTSWSSLETGTTCMREAFPLPKAPTSMSEPLRIGITVPPSCLINSR